MNYKFNIGDTVYPALCPSGYEQRSQMVIKYRKTRELQMIVSGKQLTVVSNLYSENGISFFPEETLTSKNL